MDNLHETPEQFLEHMEQMYRVNALSACVATCLASRFLKNTSTSTSTSNETTKKLCILTGAYNIFHQWKASVPTQMMMSYSLSKAMVHQLIQCMHKQQNNCPYNIVCILPKTIDTPSNRQAMPNADFSTWTPVTDISHFAFQMASQQFPYSSGSFFLLDTVNRSTSCRSVTQNDVLSKV